MNSLPHLLSRKVFFFLFAGMLLAFLVPVLIGGTESFRRASEVPLARLALLMLLISVVWMLNVIRLKLLLYRPLPGLSWISVMRIYLSIEFSSRCSPLGSAAPVTAYALLKPYGITFGEGMAIFSIAAIMDAIVLLLFITAVLVIGSHYHVGLDISTVILILFSLSFTLIIGFTVLYRHYRLIILLTEKLLCKKQVLPVKTRKKMRNLVLKYRRTIHRVSRLPLHKLVASFLVCMTYWAVYLSTLAASAAALSVDIHWLEAAFIQITAMTGGHLLMTPGGSGGAEAVGILMLSNITTTENSGAIVLVWRFLMFHLYVIVGALCFLWSMHANRRMVK